MCKFPWPSPGAVSLRPTPIRSCFSLSYRKQLKLNCPWNLYLEPQFHLVCPCFILLHLSSMRASETDSLCLQHDKCAYLLHLLTSLNNHGFLALYARGLPWLTRLIPAPSLTWHSEPNGGISSRGNTMLKMEAQLNTNEIFWNSNSLTSSSHPIFFGAHCSPDSINGGFLISPLVLYTLVARNVPLGLLLSLGPAPACASPSASTSDGGPNPVTFLLAVWFA